MLVASSLAFAAVAIAGCGSSFAANAGGGPTNAATASPPGTPQASVTDACTLATLAEVGAVFGHAPTAAVKPQVQSGTLETCQWGDDSRPNWLTVEFTQSNTTSFYDGLAPAAPGATFAPVTVSGADRAKEHDDSGVIEIVAIRAGSVVHASFDPVNEVAPQPAAARALVATMLGRA